jgi:hypothetical protein
VDADRLLGYDESVNYTPLFDLTDSSIWEEPYHVRILWITMMARKKSDHVVYADEYKLRKWSNLNSIEEVVDALRVLAAPDGRRPNQPHEGRRIEKVDGGWFLLNGEKYQEMMRKINERARKARWAREKRRRVSSTLLERNAVQRAENGDDPEGLLG